MNLQHLRHFVVLAEELHFGRAAQRLHIAQPPLSQSLARLEAMLGFKLLDRNRRSVQLTPAGAALLGEARPALLQIERGIRLARSAEEGRPQRITIGFVSSAAQSVLPHMIRALEAAWPDLEIRLSELSSDEQVRRMLAADLDVGLVYAGEHREPDLNTAVIADGSTLVALPARWPQARKRRLHLKALRDLPMVLVPRGVRPDIHALIESACHRFGFAPRIAHEVMTTSATLGLVSAGLGLGFVSGSTGLVGYPGVAFRPVTGLPAEFKWDLAMMWLARTATPAMGLRLQDIAELLSQELKACNQPPAVAGLSSDRRYSDRPAGTTLRPGS